MAFEEVTIGQCRLIRGDCREVLPALESVDAVVTDPPYGVGLRVKKNKYATRGYVHPASKTYADDPTSTIALLREVLPLLRAKSQRMAFFPGVRLLYDYPRPTSIGGVYVSSGAGHDPWGFACFHPILYYGKCPYGARRPNSFADNQPGERGIDHPCPKPLAWMKWLVNRVSLLGEMVLDPFAGSCTTGVACVQLGRAFTGVEVCAYYWELGCKRIEQAYAQPDLFGPVPRAAAVQPSLFVAG